MGDGYVTPLSVTFPAVSCTVSWTVRRVPSASAAVHVTTWPAAATRYGPAPQSMFAGNDAF